MKVMDTITEAALAERLDEVLGRASQGDDLAIAFDREVIATIRPPSAGSGAMLRELAIELARLRPLDDEFEADVKAVRANQRPAKIHEWPG